jgi:hypothetical protein
MSKLRSRIKEEFEELLPPTLYFFVTLHMVALIRALMLRGTGIPLTTSLTVALTALVLGKAVVIADMLPMINRYPDKPLIYNVAWKSVIYLLVALILHYLEHLFDYWRETGSVVAANREMLAKIVWAHFIAVQILLAVIVVLYCMWRELVRVVGRERVVQMFFGTPVLQPSSPNS